MMLTPVALLGDGTDRAITAIEADQIVATEMAAKEAKREAETPNFRVLQRRVIDFGDRKVTIDQVARPNLPPRPPKPEEREPTAAELAAFQKAMREYRQTQWISLSAVVYDNYGTPITHLRWKHEDTMYEAWSEADFNYLRTVREFTGGQDQKYQLSMFIFEESVEDMEKRRKEALAEGIVLNLPVIPELPTVEEGVSEYFVMAEDRSVFDDEAAFIALDELHAFYDANLEDSLKIKLANQEAMHEARKRYDAQNPKSKDRTINYWVIPQ